MLGSGQKPCEKAGCCNNRLVPHAWRCNTLPDVAPTGLMQNLVSMELDANNLEGTLPAAWAAMKSLKLMDLSTNYLTGSLPADWTGSPNLTLLLLGDNGFQGEELRSIIVGDSAFGLELHVSLSDMLFVQPVTHQYTDSKSRIWWTSPALVDELAQSYICNFSPNKLRSVRAHK